VGIYRYQNITSAWTAGVELEKTQRLLPHLTLKGSYGYLATHNRETGEALVRRPVHTARWELTWTPGKWSARVWGRYQGKALYQDKYDTDNQASDVYTTAYSLWSVAVSRNFGTGMTLVAKVENLFDVIQPRYGPFRGRIATIGWRWSWTPAFGA
jgi:outer membrane receptor for ferrienterochelin and colicin